jgi:tetratricopeptide (TPR) repeat protein
VDRSLGDYAGAERVLRAAIGDRTAPTPELATLMVNLADILREEARGNEARVVLDEAGRLPDLSRAARMNVLMETAEMDLDLRLCEESKELWTEVGAIAGNDDPAVDAAVNAGLGESWMVEGNLARAEPLLRKSLQLLRNDPRSSPLQLATALAALGQLYLNEDKLALAAEAVNEAIAKDEESLGTAHPQVGALLEVEAIILSRHGEAQAARDKLERAQVIMSSHFGPESVAVAVVFAGMGEVELRANRPKEAASQYGHALQIFRQAGVEGSEPGLALAARYAAALKAAHLSAKTAPDRGQTVAGNDTARGFREK